MFIKFNLILSPFPPDCSTPIIYFNAFSRSSSRYHGGQLIFALSYYFYFAVLKIYLFTWRKICLMVLRVICKKILLKSWNCLSQEVVQRETQRKRLEKQEYWRNHFCLSLDMIQINLDLHILLDRLLDLSFELIPISLSLNKQDTKKRFTSTYLDDSKNK